VGKKEGTVFMNYVGIDLHKKYSVLSAQDERGRKLKEARVEGTVGTGMRAFSVRWRGRVKRSWKRAGTGA
jgi:hypothetical protein